MTTKVHPYKRVLIGELLPAEVNPRVHSNRQIEQLRRSIREFGFTNPLLIDEHGKIIAGHGRLAAAKLEGLADLPAIEVGGLSDSQKRALLIADNQLAINADWDEQLLASELKSLMNDDFDLSLIGFSQLEVDDLLKQFEPGAEQPALDIRVMIQCPQCGHQFHRP